MNELIETYRLEIESLKIQNDKLINKNKMIYNKHKNIKRTNLRLRKIINILRNQSLNNVIEETIGDNWDCIDESHD